MLDALLSIFSRDIGIDLGTANTLVHVRDRDRHSEPSVVPSTPRRRRCWDGAERADGGPNAATSSHPPPARRGLQRFDVTER